MDLLQPISFTNQAQVLVKNSDIGSKADIIKKQLTSSSFSSNNKVNIESVGPDTVLPDGENTPDRYKVIDQIGSGGLGTVWKGIDTSSNKFVAMKFLKSGSHPQDDIRRFLREAKGLSKVDHPNVVKVFDVASFGKHGPYLIMDYLEGPTLELKINDRKRNGIYKLSKDEKLEFLDLLIKIANGLNAIHETKVIHRDLKSSNIIITAGGPVIIDFGFAKVEGASTITHGGSFGTPAYMPPEQIQDSSNIDGRTDLYSLGVILYEAFTGVNPFSANNRTLTLIRQSDVVPKEPKEIDGTIPAELNILIKRLLMKNPNERLGTAGEVRDTLIEIKKSLLKNGSLKAPSIETLASRYAFI